MMVCLVSSISSGSSTAKAGYEMMLSRPASVSCIKVKVKVKLYSLKSDICHIQPPATFLGQNTYHLSNIIFPGIIQCTCHTRMQAA